MNVRAVVIALVLSITLSFSARQASAQYAASPFTQLSMHSDQGDYVGAGQDYLFNANDGNFTDSVEANSSGKVDYVTINFNQGTGGEDWEIQFSTAKLGTELTPGVYNQAVRAPFAQAGQPGLDISGDSRGSNTLTGKFTVTEAVYDYTSSPARLVSFAATFEQHSDGGTPALTGAIYYNSFDHPQIADTSHPSTTVSLSGTIGQYGRYSSAVQVALSATDPDGAGDVVATYYALDNSVQQTYKAAFTVAAEGMHTLHYYSVDKAGNQEPTQIQTIWIDTSPPPSAPAQTRLVMHSQPGDYVGRGNDYLYTDADGTFTATAASSQSYSLTDVPPTNIGVRFSTANYSDWWDLDFSTQQLGKPIAVGEYDGAMREAFTALGHPGMEISGNGAGSNTLTGKFTVLDLVLDYSTSTTSPQVVSFAATFEQHSEGAVPALTGVVYYHSTAYVGTPIALSFTPSTVTGGVSTTGNISIATPAPAGGEVIALSSGSPDVVSTPATVTVPAGMLSATFPISTTAVGVQSSIPVTASANGVTSTATLTVGLADKWTTASIAVGTDGKTRLLWTKADGSASFWSVPVSGAIVHSATYGPYSGWTARKVAPGPNGATDIYWTTSGGGASYWQVSSSGAITYSPTWGPYAGWTPKDFSANGDGSARLLWTSPNGAASFWTIAANGSIKHSPTYGPYGGWTTAHIASAPGGATRLLWNNSNGSASVWTVAANGSVAYSPTYGPFAGWSCANIGVGGDGKTKLQWNNGDATSFWTLGANSTVAYSPVWGPFSGWSPSDFAVAPDNSVRLLWNSPSGAASFWNVSPGYGVGYSATYGPF